MNPYQVKHIFFTFSVLILLSFDAKAETFRVDDSATIATQPQIKMKWRNTALNNQSSMILDGSTFVTIRLNTANWLNKKGQIYMVLPYQPIGTVAVDWTTQGRLLPGNLVSGNRTLVYAGIIQSPVIEDTIKINLQSDGSRLTLLHRLEFYFEIDVD